MLQILIIFILSVFLYNLLEPGQLFKRKKKEKKKSSLDINEKLFMTREETIDFLRTDEDNFVNNLNTINKKARGVNNIYVYMDKITEAAESYSKEDKELLQKTLDKAEKMILNTPNKQLMKYGMNIERLKMLRGIRLALTRGKIYENGFPHTRGNVIFFSTDYLEKNRDKPEKVLKTMIHEIVHIYQRNNGKIYDGFLKQEFWSIVLNPKDTDRRRMNPDLDLDIWEKDGRIYMAKFTSNNPKSLDEIDIAGESEYEHPYEFYAYKFSIDILNNFM